MTYGNVPLVLPRRLARPSQARPQDVPGVQGELRPVGAWGRAPPPSNSLFLFPSPLCLLAFSPDTIATVESVEIWGERSHNGPHGAREPQIAQIGADVVRVAVRPHSAHNLRNPWFPSVPW